MLPTRCSRCAGPWWRAPAPGLPHDPLERIGGGDLADALRCFRGHGIISRHMSITDYRALCRLAHNVHPSDDELHRLGTAGATVAHCPSTSTRFLGEQLPLRRHVAAGVRVALGADVGAGTGFGMLRKVSMAYEMQMLMPEGVQLVRLARSRWRIARRGSARRRGRGYLEPARAPTSCSFVRQQREFVGGRIRAGVVDRGDARRRVHARARRVDRRGVRVAGEVVWPR